MSNTERQFQIPEEVRKISQALSHANFENYLVGGSVRDLIMGRVPKDWDLATNATPEEIQKIFPDSFYENKFGTVGLKTKSSEIGIIEVTPYRTESKYSDARHPDEVTWAKTIEEDLARRDFTVNAIALNLQPTTDNKQLIDPYGGEADIEKKIIRTVGKPDERFGEDALRMFRALRFASELNFVIELETQSAIEKNTELLSNISKERIKD